MNSLDDMNRIARIGTMALDFEVTGMWSGFTVCRKDGMLKRVETRTLGLRPNGDSRIQLSNGDAFDSHKLEMNFSSEYLSPKDIFNELDDQDLGHIGYAFNNNNSVHIYAYMLWCPEISVEKLLGDISASMRIRTSNVPFRSEFEDKFLWKAGPDNIIRISEVQFISKKCLK